MVLATCEIPPWISLLAFNVIFTKSSFGRFLHIALHAPKEVFREERVKIGWSIIRHRHPLLMCKVLVDGNDLNTARLSSVSTPI